MLFNRTWTLPGISNYFGYIFLGGGDWWREKCYLFFIFLEDMVLVTLC